MKINWEAYCLDCKETLGVACPNGSFAEAEAKHHIREHPTHEVLVGSRYKAEEIQSED